MPGFGRVLDTTLAQCAEWGKVQDVEKASLPKLLVAVVIREEEDKVEMVAD